MQILLVRHGEAIEEAPGGDASRWLTGRGRKRTRKVAAWLGKAKARKPAEVWTSPLVRAVQTAEILAERVGLTEDVSVRNELSPGHDPREILDLLAKRAADAGPIALVGHEPGLSLLATSLLGAASWPGIKKSGVVALMWDGAAKAELAFLLEPKGLEMVRDVSKLVAAPKPEETPEED